MDTGEQAGEETSACRRERLLALRSSSAAAAAASSTSPSAAPPPPPPAWDLPEPDLAPTSSAPRPRTRTRFDFYTNPGAAFSSAAAVPHKRKSADPPPPPHGNYGNNYPPPHEHHMAPSPMEGAPGNSPWRSPMQFQTPMSGYRGTPPGPPPHWNPHSTPPAQDQYPHPPNFGFRGRNAGRGGSPMNYRPKGSSMDYGPRGSPMDYGPRGSPRSYVPRGSPHLSSGRGRGENYYNSPGPRGRGGRGGFHNHSGSQDQRNYYRKSMVDDPWQDLQPIVGSILIPIDGAKSWLPESLRKKKEAPNQGRTIPNPTSGLSLAEYLDLSFNEASNESNET